MEHLLELVSPVDILFAGTGFISGILVVVRRLKNNPYRNLSILLQVSLLLIKFTKHYYDTHPESKAKLNVAIMARLDKIVHQLDEYMGKDKGPQVLPPAG